MPNHVTHRMMFNEGCDALIMQMKLQQANNNNGGRFLDFDFFCPGPSGTVELQRAKWGTKWNAYDQDDSDIKNQGLTFDTAWCTCGLVWEALAEKFPGVEITIYYADEDTGNNLGYIYISGGVVTYEELSESPAAEKVKLLNFIYPDGNYFHCVEKGWIINVDHYDDEELKDECPEYLTAKKLKGE